MNLRECLRAVHQIQLGQQIPRQNVRDRGIQMLANLRIFRIQRAHVRLRGLVVGVHRGRRVLAGEQTQHIEDRVVNMLARDARIRMVDGPRPADALQTLGHRAHIGPQIRAAHGEQFGVGELQTVHIHGRIPGNHHVAVDAQAAGEPVHVRFAMREEHERGQRTAHMERRGELVVVDEHFHTVAGARVHRADTHAAHAHGARHLLLETGLGLHERAHGDGIGDAERVIRERVAHVEHAELLQCAHATFVGEQSVQRRLERHVARTVLPCHCRLLVVIVYPTPADCETRAPSLRKKRHIRCAKRPQLRPIFA